MKMNATKLTIALVALLLALTCVFAACGKKNNTDKPDDTTPVDNTPATVDTVAKEDLNAIAESLKSAYAANYVDLYAPATATDIEAAKSAALINIFAASSKEEAQKVADDFIAFLKSQKTIIDTIAALVEKIGDVSLKDADALNELTDVVATLDAAYAGTNEAKAKALKAYKDDAATQKTIKDIVDRYNQLKAAKVDADVKKGAIKADGTKATDDGLNLAIAALKADFTAEGKEFLLADFGEYEDLLAKMAAFAKEYDIVVDSEAYADVFDTASLKAAKAALDAAFGEDAVLKDMLTIVEQAKALEAAADAAQWREYIYVNAEYLDVKDEKDTTYSVALNIDGETKYGKFAYVLKDASDGAGNNKANTAIQLPDGVVKYYDGPHDDTANAVKTAGNFAFTAYATEEAAKNADVKKIAKVEAEITVDYKLTLKADVEKAVAAVEAVMKTHSTTELEDNYKYGEINTTTGDPIDPVAPAVAKINALALAYKASVTNAYNAYKAAFGTNAAPSILGKKTNVNLATAKDDTLGTYDLTKETALDKNIKFTNKDVAENQNDIFDAIEAAIKNFTAQDEASGAFVSGKTAYTATDDLDHYDYAAKDGDSTSKHSYNLVGGAPTISYTAWTYRYQLEEKDDLPTGYAAFDVLKTLANEDNNAAKAKAALRFLAMYIGDGDYADSYDFTEYKKYEGQFNDEVLYMTDRDITEVAVPVVVKIRGEAVNVAKNETDVGAKLLSPYTVAKALVAEEEKIVAAKEKVQEELVEAALALRTAGDAKAVANARKFYDKIADGRELNERLEYGLDDYFNGYTTVPALDNSALFTYLGVSTLGNLEAKVQTKPTVEKRKVNTLITDAATALSAAKASFVAIEATKPTDYVKFATLEGYQTAIDNADLAMAANNAALATFAELINEANRQLEVAKAGVAAKFLNGDLNTATDAAGNITKNAAQKSLERVTSMQSIFSNYGSFYSDYAAGTKYINAKAFDDDTADTTDNYDSAAAADFTSYLNDFRPDTVAQKDYDNVIDRLVAIVQASDFSATVVTSNEDTARQSELKKAKEKDLKKDLGNYETKILASDVYAAVVANPTILTTAAGAISNFANEYFADYVNLKVSYPIGSETFEFDYLTETFKDRVLYNSQSVIQKVIDYANDTSTSNPTITAAAGTKLTKVGTGSNDCWEVTVSATIDNLGATFNTVTSIKDAETAVNSSTVADSNYKYDTAKNAINTVTGNTATVAAIKEYVRTH